MYCITINASCEKRESECVSICYMDGMRAKYCSLMQWFDTARYALRVNEYPLITGEFFSHSSKSANLQEHHGMRQLPIMMVLGNSRLIRGRITCLIPL